MTKTVAKSAPKAMQGITAGDLNDAVLSAFIVAQESLGATTTKFFSHQGEVVTTEEVVDHSTRLDAVKIILHIAELAAKLNPEETAKQVPNIVINCPPTPAPPEGESTPSSD